MEQALSHVWRWTTAWFTSSDNVLLRDHQLLVGRDDVDRNAAAGTRYQARVAGILGLVERHTKPPQLIGDTRPDTIEFPRYLR